MRYQIRMLPCNNYCSLPKTSGGAKVANLPPEGHKQPRPPSPYICVWYLTPCVRPTIQYRQRHCCRCRVWRKGWCITFFFAPLPRNREQLMLDLVSKGTKIATAKLTIFLDAPSPCWLSHSFSSELCWRTGTVLLPSKQITIFCNCVCPLLEGPKRIRLGKTISTRYYLSSAD